MQYLRALCGHRLAAERLPEFLKRPDSTTVPLGNDAKFEVVVDGEPRPTVKWSV